VPFLDHPLGDRRPDPAAADYQYEHLLNLRSECLS